MVVSTTVTNRDQIKVVAKNLDISEIRENPVLETKALFTGPIAFINFIRSALLSVLKKKKEVIVIICYTHNAKIATA